MNHFATARQESIRIACDTATQALAKRLCLIFDLQGRIRILAELEDHHDSKRLQQTLDGQLVANATGFWSGEFWFHRGEGHPLGKVSPSERSLYDAVWRQAKPCSAAPHFCFLLDRHYSKEGWFSTDIDPVWTVQGVMPPIVSFYSYKGGVGRTTALAAFALQCARVGKRVLVCDFDLEAPGIGSVFPPGSHTPEVGILDYLLEFPVLGKTFDAAETLYIYDNPAATKGGEPIMVTPAGTVDEWYLEKLGRLNFQSLAESLAPRASQDSGLKQLLFRLREQSKPDIILIDSRAGLHDLGGLTLSGLAHWHVLFGLDSDQSWLGMRVAISRLGKGRILNNRNQEDCMLVQSLVPPQYGKEESIERFRLKSFDVFRDEYYNDSADSDSEWPLPDEQSSEEPHFPIPLVFDNRVMGYRSLDQVAEYLCEGDFKAFGAALLQKLGITR